MTDFHFIRPFWLFALIPLGVQAYVLFRQTPVLKAWSEICDLELLKTLMKTPGKSKRALSLTLLFASAFFMILSLAGPTWTKMPVPLYKKIEPRVVVLDMSEDMLMDDLAPDRLSRAKFKLHDLFQNPKVRQMGLIVYSGEPFSVSPLTDDSQTIDSLLPSLTSDVLPVDGQRLDLALDEAKTLFKQAGYKTGDLLVLTSTPPSRLAIEKAQALAKEGYHSSIMPMLTDASDPNFKQFAKAGLGQYMPFSDHATDIDEWLRNTDYGNTYKEDEKNEIPVWRDQGRWFLFPALLFLAPVFWRGWLQRVTS